MAYEILAKKMIDDEHDFYENWLFVFEVLDSKDFKSSWDWISIKKNVSFINI